MIGIYKLYNNITKKSYIGKSTNIEKRFIEHKNMALRGDGYYIHSSIAKYGVENFDFIVLEECEEKELNKREKYYIEMFNSFENGYNLTTGGDGFDSFSSPTSKFSKEEIILIREHYNNRTYSGYAEMMADLFPNRVDEKTFLSIFHGQRYSGVMPEVFTNDNISWYKVKAKKLSIKKGENHGRSNLTDLEAVELRILYNFIRVKDLSLIFDMSNGGIENIVEGQRYSDLPVYKKTLGIWENTKDEDILKLYLPTIEKYLPDLEHHNIKISNRGNPIIVDDIFYFNLKDASRKLNITERSIREGLKRRNKYYLSFQDIILKLRTDL